MQKANGIHKLQLIITRNLKKRNVKASRKRQGSRFFFPSTGPRSKKKPRTQDLNESSSETHPESQLCCEEESTSMDEVPQKNIGSFFAPCKKKKRSQAQPEPPSFCEEDSDSMDQSQQKQIGSFFAPRKKKQKKIRSTGSQLWKKVGNINVYHSDFASMDTGCWITDTIIDAFSSLLPTTDNKVVFNARIFLQIKN